MFLQIVISKHLKELKLKGLNSLKFECIYNKMILYTRTCTNGLNYQYIALHNFSNGSRTFTKRLDNEAH